MTHPYIKNGQSWAFALRTLLGYPVFAPARHTVAFSTSGPRDLEKDRHLADIAIEMQRDFVHLTFVDIDAPEPSEIGLAVLGHHGVHWLPKARLFAASERAPLEMLHGDKRWRIDERNQLVSYKLPARHLLTRGEQVAWQRLRKMAAALDGLELTGGKFVMLGGSYQDAHDVADLQVAA
ncbi:hypothetical protein ACGGKE_03495 [Sphingobium naphthae]|uniref:hypothetical protein n=1 Tax=Sphingobium naphthae TaxID=1886786 RepID=UPI0037496C85